MFPEGMDMNALLQQAQAMQAQMAEAQQKMASTEYTGSAGGDLVKATVTGTGELTALSIKPEACDPEDTETLADLIIAAVRDANGQAQQAAAAAMPQIPGGLGF